MKRALAACMLALFAAGCAQAPSPPPSPPLSSQAAMDDSFYRHALRTGHEVFAIDPAASLIAVTVRKGGAFARFGHDHVVASHGVSGFVSLAAGRADFQFRADSLTVDEAPLRREAGFEPDLDTDAIAGTRANMLKRVLEAEHYPWVVMHAQRSGGDALSLTITLHGVSRTMSVPALIEHEGGSVTAQGAFQIKQTDFGITPMSLLGGALAVQDTLDLRFKLVARKAH